MVIFSGNQENNKNMKTVYLIGTLSEDPATHIWRDEAVKLLQGFNTINPAASIYDRKLLDKSDGDPKVFYKWTRKKVSEILLPKSFQSVIQSDILLANLAIEPVGRPMIGTIFEIAWAWQLNKPIIAIKDDNFYSQHPMVTKAVHALVDSVEEGCKIIVEFFS